MAVDADHASTSLKTHRHLRLSLVFIVFALLVGVLVQTIVLSWSPLTLGWDPQPSISHYALTPARGVFMGAMIAASLALLALSGRDRATTLLDIAAVFAPLIAIVPTGVAVGRPVEGLACGDGAECVSRVLLDEVRLGVAVYAIVVVAAVITTAIIRARKRIRSPSARLVSVIAIVVALTVSALAFVPGLNDGFPFNFWPVRSIHFAVTLLFFAAFTAVPLLYARAPEDAGGTPPSPRQRAIYRWISWLMIADLAALLGGVLYRQFVGETPLVLIGEAVALSLFAWFWWVQTFQRWDDPDPPSLTASRLTDEHGSRSRSP